MKRWIALLLVNGAAWGGVQAAARAPEAVVAIERDIADDPVSVLRDARAQAAALAPGPNAQRLPLLVRQVVAAMALERDDEAGAVLPEAQALARQLRAGDMQCVLQAASLYLEDESKGWASVAGKAAGAVQAARASTETWCLPRLQAMLLTIHANGGRTAAALEAGQEAEAKFAAAGETLGLAGVRSSLSWVLRERDDDTESVRRSVELAEQAVNGLDPQRHRYQTASSLHDLVGARIAAKDWTGARRDAAAAERLLRVLHMPTALAYMGRLRGEIELRDGKPALALPYLREARRALTEARVDQLVVATATMEAEALVDLHRPQQALRALAEAAPLRERLGLPKTDVPYFRVEMDARAADQDAAGTAAAAHAYAQALERRLNEENHRRATELQERYASAQREAENRLLRGQQEVQRARMLALVALLALAGALVIGLGVVLVRQRRQRARLKRLAEVDELTGLPNRRAILEILNDASARQRGGRAIAMLDIDHFKRVNDRFGHAAGDAALSTFAQVCSGMLREGDVMGRLGGEEFLIVFHRARAAELQPLFERMRGALRATPIAGMPVEERISFCMGAVDLAAQASTQAALVAADEALYRAKSGGRDRMEIGIAPRQTPPGAKPAVTPRSEAESPSASQPC